MKPRAAYLITGIISILIICVNSWPVSKAEVVSHAMLDIPQWHCLRYFKHDIHLMRRCRNHRLPSMIKPKD